MPSWHWISSRFANAGTYTPFSLVGIGGATGWWLFGMVWGLGLLGITIDTLRRAGGGVLSVAICARSPSRFSSPRPRGGDSA